ncbi:hypothetical protein RSAG8_13102, partial [Rhizoctonia solani AG-8 WAC10335]
MWASYLAKIPYIRVSAGSLDPEKEASPVSAETTRSSPKSASYRTWSLVMWPLVAHAYMSLGVVAFMINYVHNRDFNLEQRRPFVKLANGTEVPWVHYAPLQTDITTALSIMLAILRLITACWLGPLSWRCAFFLMEAFGLRPRQLDMLVSYDIYTTPLSGTPRHDKRFLRFIVWALLLIVLPVHLSAPVLTGSIAWISSNPPPEQLFNSTITTLSPMSYEEWNSYTTQSKLRFILQYTLEAAATRPFIAWGRDTSNVALKRYSSEFSGLEINSTVANVTLPYFTVQSIEWIDNPNSMLSSNQFGIINSVCPKLNMMGPCPLKNTVRDALTLVPDTPWTNETSQSPSMVTERRLMVYQSPVNWSSYSAAKWECRQDGKLNPNVSAHQEDGLCWKFAWVTYSAGAAICRNCRVSSYATVQNDTALVLREAHMTAEALRMIPFVISEMLSSGDGQAALPRWDNVDDYVIGMLTRAYAGAWIVLNEAGNSQSLVYTKYAVSPLAARAVVNILRVYIWLGLQSLVTLSGILFLYTQAQSSSPLIGDMTLAAFHLDSSALHEDGAYNQLWGGAGRKVELEDGYLMVKVVREK